MYITKVLIFTYGYFRSPDHNESPHRGRDRRERDVTPVYDSRTGSAHEPPASGKIWAIKDAPSRVLCCINYVSKVLI